MPPIPHTPTVAARAANAYPPTMASPSTPFVNRTADRWIALALGLGVATLLTALRAAQMGRIPTGLDGGEWLAIGRGLLGGPGRSTEGAYAPLVPTIAASLGGTIGEVEAVRWIAIGSLLILLAAVAVVTAQVGAMWVSPVAVAVVGSSSTVIEPMAFGGYPQNIAVAATLLAASGTSAWLTTGNKWWMAAMLGGTVVGTLAHHVYGLTTIVTVAGVAALSRLLIGSLPRARWAPVSASVVIGIACLAPTLLAFRRAGYQAPLSASFTSRWDAWTYATREATAFWVALTVVALLLGILRMRRPEAWLARSGFILLVGGLVAFAAVGQVRAMPMVTIGAVLIVSDWLATVELSRAPLAIPAASVAMAIWLGVLGTREAASFFAFYRVLDQSLVNAAAAIDQDPTAGAVAVPADHHQWPIGWWYEGLMSRPVIVGSDPEWLGFPGELRHAETAQELFDGSLSPTVLRQRAVEAGVSMFAMKKWDWIGWQRWLGAESPAVEVIYDDNITIVLRLTGTP